MSERAAPLSFAPLGILIISALAAAVAAFQHLGPDSAGMSLFTSDSGISVLMANDPHWDPFRLFFYGQDRFGAWPFWLAHGLGALLHQEVSPVFLHGLAVLALFSGIIPAMNLGRPGSTLAGFSYIVAILVPDTRQGLFELAQVYPWQIPMLFWSWWGIRCFQQRPSLTRGVIAAVLCSLTTWLSALSGPMLLAVTIVECWPGRSLRVWARQLSAPLVGVLVEVLLRWEYHRYARAQFHNPFSTSMRADWGNLGANAVAVIRHLESSGSLWVLVTLILGLLFVGTRRSSDGEGRFPAGFLRTVTGALVLAGLPVPILILLSHIRLNHFAERYFTPVSVLSRWGAFLLVSVLGFQMIARRARRWAPAVTSACLAAVVFGLLPRELSNPEFLRMRETAKVLVRKAPGAILLDGYWGTYAFAALALPGELKPLPRSGEWNRLPWLEGTLTPETVVLVGHRGLLQRAPGEVAPPWLLQYGTILRRESAAYYSDGVDDFSLYRPVAHRPEPLIADPSLETLDLEAHGGDLIVTIPTGKRDGLAALELGCESLPRPVLAEGQDRAGRSSPIAVESRPGVIMVRPQPDIRQVHWRFAATPCHIPHAVWLDAEPG